ncbi:uncharacterized protein LOC113542132 isoform X2 [Pangasianodon hypophthalmus]|uniref:uncharacterized protein LOC113542132 isoform X2 n=1 Tax=Pangasianodon hypophthalmus TaxID=310915 RepID=UPI002307C717|nr:uncharacterized protein LOC113542132 isoform X2 [Pangasianodon hypophthalmus]
MMADRKQPIKSASRKHGSDKTRSFPHLKPLSVYSRMVFYKATDSCLGSPSWSPDSPSWNLNLELSNSKTSVGHKRRLDDSCLDETYDTPPKKPCFAKHPSPASAYVLDSFDAFRQVKLVSPQSSSVILEEIKRVEKPLSHQKSLGRGWIDGNDKTDGRISVSLTNVHSSSPVIVHNEDSADVIAFDYDENEIMCLSPIDSADVSADGLEDFIQSRQIYYEEFPAEEGHSSWCSSRQKQGKSECLLGKDAQMGSDEGYVTKSYYSADPGESKVTTESEITKSDEVHFIKSYKITIPNLSNDKTPPVSTPFMSTPLEKFRELVKRTPILSPKLDLDKESWSSPTVICESVKASSAISLRANVNLDAGNTEAFPRTIPFLNVNESKEGNIVREGTSIQKSLVCHYQEKQTANQVKAHEDVLSVSQQQTDSEIRVMFREETDTTDSFKITLPLQVQVKSKVGLPNTQQPEAVKARARQQPEKKATSEGQRNVFKDIPRPVVLYREEDWEKEKKVYVDSVTRHMTDNVEGVMNELLQLMNAIANQRRGHDGRKWQHPSDLTRRNYQLRNSNRLLSLDEWQNLSYRNHRRFAKVPQMFKRSRVL